jgi:2-C-methyl-D-erythritol 4-phosphate cytidylyltransferase
MARPGGRLRAVAVVPAGGVGTRMRRRLPKQYLLLGGVPVLVHTLRLLLGCKMLDGLVLVVPGRRVDATRRVLRRYQMPRILDVVAGGADRQESVWHGLQAVPAATSWVVVHDAVRPFITVDLVQRVLAAAHRHGAATCGLPVRETVKRVRGGTVDSTLEREGLWLVQTPQAFRRDLLWEAHDKARRDGFAGTDDAILVERLGERVTVVAGLPQNLKITTPEDLISATRWLGSAAREARRRSPRRRR